jgi:amino-acid N-acetyltransferase
MTASSKIIPIQFDDQVQQFLESEKLPFDDLLEENQVRLFGIKQSLSEELPDDETLVGVIGIEVYENSGFLRSLVVSETERGKSIGSELVRYIEAWAKGRDVQQLYLLTVTATDYFTKLGYQVIPREQAPISVQNTTQFKGLCPGSAAFLTKTI